MTATYLNFSGGNDRDVMVEVRPIVRKGSTLVPASAESQFKKASVEFESVLDDVISVASRVGGRLSGLSTTVSDIEVKFGLSLTADAGVIVARASAEGSFEITLTWKKQGASSAAT